MQDNKDIANINEQFTDLGWEKMQGVLDKEMPVTPVRKRRWAWLWLLLFLGIMAGGTYYNFAVKSTTQPNKIPDITVADVIENTKDINKFEKNNQATQHSEEKKIEKITNTSKTPVISDIPLKEKTINSPKITPKKVVEKNVVKNNLHIKKENNFINKKTSTTQIPRTEGSLESSYGTVSRRIEANDLTAKVASRGVPIISEKEPTKSIEPSIAASTKTPSRNSSANTKRIATLSPQITRNNIAFQVLPEAVPAPKIRKFSHTYSTFAGVRSDEFTDFGGVNAGLLAHYRFTPKVGLEIGLAYANFRKNINTYIDYTAEFTAEYPSNTQQLSRTVTDALNLHYLRFPLSFTYRPHPKIQLATGLSAGYRFAINEKFGAYSESNDNGINSADDTSIVILNNDTYQSSFEVDAESVGAEVLIMNPGQSIAVPYSFSIHKWDLAAQAGLRYYPIPRLGIDLSYQHGLLNMTKNTDTNRNSGLQLALVWQLHR